MSRIKIVGPNRNSTVISGQISSVTMDGVQIWPALAPTQPPIQSPTTNQLSEPITNILATDNLATIQSKINSTPVGGSVVFPAMTIPGPIKGKSGITLWASGVVNLGGPFTFDDCSDWKVGSAEPGKGFVFKGDYRLFANRAVNWTVGNNVFNDITSPENWWNGTAIVANGASNGLVINNDFNNCMGNVVGMYDLNVVTFDGNHFNGCWQPFSIQVPTTTDKTKGHDLIWRRNIFLGTQRACIEVGPASTGEEYFSGLIVENNFFDDFDCKGAAGTMLPISLVGQASENTIVRNNFVRKGSRPSVNTSGDFEWTTGLEFTGSGECTGNTVVGFRYLLLYKSGWNIHDNTIFGAPLGFTINQAGATGINVNNKILTSPPDAPAMPTRIAW